jgi:hypothetical protein
LQELTEEMELWTWDHTLDKRVAKCMLLILLLKSPAKTLAKKSVVEFF